MGRGNDETRLQVLHTTDVIADSKIVQQQLLATLEETAALIAQAQQVRALDAWPHLAPARPHLTSDAADVQLSRDELATQLAVSRHIVATLDLGPLLSGILEQLERIEHFDGAAIFMVEGEGLAIRASRSHLKKGKLQGKQVDLTRAKTLRTVMTTRQPL